MSSGPNTGHEPRCLSCGDLLPTSSGPVDHCVRCWVERQRLGKVEDKNRTPTEGDDG